jgi:hypothetical protein
MLIPKRNLAMFIKDTDYNIKFEKDKTYIVDGKILLKIPMISPYDANDYPVIDGISNVGEIEPFVMDNKTRAKALKALSNKATLPILRETVVCDAEKTNNSDKVVIATTDLDNATIIQGTKTERYPDCETIFDKVKKEPVFSISISVQVLETLVDVLKKNPDYNKSITEVIQFDFFDEINPIGIKNRDITGVMMPCRKE